MIRSLEIEQLRGIEKGALEGLTPLTILTGPNGCGKSTILDALLLGVHAAPHEALGFVVERHVASWGGAAWLIHEAKAKRMARIEVVMHTGSSLRECWLQRCAVGSVAAVEAPGNDTPSPAGPYDRIDYFTELVQKPPYTCRYFGINNRSWTPEEALAREPQAEALPALDTRYLDGRRLAPFDKLYSDAVRRGLKRQTLDLLRELDDSIADLEILTEEDGRPGLYAIKSDHAVPMALMGDGVAAMTRLALELAPASSGLVLLEEAETFLHPRAMRLCARALCAAVERGTQVVMTTHSIELLDAIVEAAGEAVDTLSLFNLKLDSNILKYSHHAGEEMVFARRQMEHDLR